MEAPLTVNEKPAGARHRDVGASAPSRSRRPSSAEDLQAVTGVPDLPVLRTLEEIVELQSVVGPLYLRYSRGPVADAHEQSRDKESGCVLPGLSTNPITPEPWWDRPPEQWVARQLVQYDHLAQREPNIGWLLTGEVVGRGPDCEPLLADVTALAVIAPECTEVAEQVYHATFAAGRR